MDYTALIIGFFIGILFGAGALFIFYKLNEKKKEISDDNNVFNEIETLKKRVEKFKEDADNERGSVKQILEDMRTAEQDVGKFAREIKQTLLLVGVKNKVLGAN